MKTPNFVACLPRVAKNKKEYTDHDWMDPSLKANFYLVRMS